MERQVQAVTEGGEDVALLSQGSDDFEPVNVKKARIEPVPQADANEAEEDDNDDEEQEEEDDDDGSEGCPICFEQWTTSGFHRLVSLKCGHLFGKRCIERWLSAPTRTKCPQCNAPAKRSDIRILYAKRLIAMDTSEKEGLVREVQEERIFKRMAIEAEAKANVALQAALAELEQTKAELKKLKMRLSTFSTGDDDDLEAPKFSFYKSFKLASQPGACRCLDFDAYHSTLLASKAHHKGAGHGICKVSLLDESVDYIPDVHQDLVRCISHSPFQDGLILSTGNDKTVAVTTSASNVVVTKFKLPAAGWSCLFDRRDGNRVFAGTSNGLIACFDMRWPDQPQSMLKPDLKRPLPVHSIFSSRENQLICATLDGPFAVSTNDDQIVWRWSPEQSPGMCTSINFNGTSLLASYRVQNSPMALYTGSVTDAGVLGMDGFASESSQTVMTRSALLESGLAIIPDEPSSSLHLYHPASKKLSSKLETRARTPILDVKQGKNSQHGTIIAALTDTDLFVFNEIIDNQ